MKFLNKWKNNLNLPLSFNKRIIFIIAKNVEELKELVEISKLKFFKIFHRKIFIN